MSGTTSNTIVLKKHMDKLGLKVKCRVTGFSGVIVSVGFDLYGCVQAIVHPGLGEDKKLAEPQWLDINRLEILSETPVMDRPNFEYGPQANGDSGASEKPRNMKA